MHVHTSHGPLINHSSLLVELGTVLVPIPASTLQEVAKTNKHIFHCLAIWGPWQVVPAPPAQHLWADHLDFVDLWICQIPPPLSCHTYYHLAEPVGIFGSIFRYGVTRARDIPIILAA